MNSIFPPTLAFVSGLVLKTRHFAPLSFVLALQGHFLRPTGYILLFVLLQFVFLLLLHQFALRFPLFFNYKLHDQFPLGHLCPVLYSLSILFLLPTLIYIRPFLNAHLLLTMIAERRFEARSF